MSGFVEFLLRFQSRSRKSFSQSDARAATCFTDRPENTNFVEDVDIMLPVKFCLIPFSGFRGEVVKMSANQTPGRPLVLPIGPKDTNLVEDVQIMPFAVEVSLNSVQLFERRSRKCFSQSRGQGGQVVNPIGPENTKVVEDVQILLPVKFH